MDPIRQNFSAYFRAAQIIFFALLGGQVLASVVLLFVMTTSFHRDIYEGEHSRGISTGITLTMPHTNPAFKDAYFAYLAPVVMAGLLGLAFYLFSIKKKAASGQSNLQEKLLAYRSAQILKWAPIEAATLIGVVTFALSGNKMYLLLAGLFLLVFVFQRPSKNQLVADLDLTSEEQSILDDPNKIVVTYSKTRN